MLFVLNMVGTVCVKLRNVLTFFLVSVQHTAHPPALMAGKEGLAHGLILLHILKTH